MSGEKTEKPSADRLSKAREKGQIPRSKDLAAALSLLIIPYMLYLWLGGMATQIKNIFAFNLVLTREELFEPMYMATQLGHSLLLMLQLLWPLMAIVATVGIVGNVMVGGWNFSLESLQPSLDKLSPLKGIKKIFSSQSVIELIKSILKIGLISTVMYYYFQQAMPTLIALLDMDLVYSLPLGAKIIFMALVYMAVTMAAIGLIDTRYQMWKYLDGLKMSKQDLKDEHKNKDGNPEVKGKIRQLAREIALGGMRKAIPTADVIITNPTHYAVALKYDPLKSEAPYVVAKGSDYTAIHIRILAKQHGIEIVETAPLTRAIYYNTRINQQIPADLYVAVAHILHYVLRLKAYRSGQGDVPPEDLPNFQIPDALRR